MKKIVSFIKKAAFVAVVLFLCFLIYTMSQGKRVSVAGYQVLRVLTDSMEPTIAKNTCIIIKEVPIEEVQVGDIITFVSKEEKIQGFYNTHRVQEVVHENGQTYFITKGDKSEYVDEGRVSGEQFVGVYVRELPGGQLIGKAFLALADSRIYFIFIIFPLLLCLVSYAWQIFGIITGRERVDEDEDDEEEIS